LLEFGSVRVLPNIGVRLRFGWGSFQLRKNESSVLVRFFMQSLRFCSVRFYAGSEMNILLKAAQVREIKFEHSHVPSAVHSKS